MRCFCCDAMDADHYDGAVNRYYCTTCRIAIEEIMFSDADILRDDEFSLDADEGEVNDET